MEPPHGSRIHAEGTRGKTLFWQLHGRTLKGAGGSIEDYQAALQDAINRNERKLAADGGDRAMAVCGALVLEQSLNNLLSTWIPGFHALDEERESTFAFKVELARACQLVPEHLVAAIGPIRKLRNEFAHDLELASFDDAGADALWQSLQDHLDKLVDQVPANRRDSFKALVLIVTAVLDVYTTHARRACQYIRDPQNSPALLGTG